jgi:membrane protein
VNRAEDGPHASDLARLAGMSAWDGLVGFYKSDNLTHAASIAYYALLSLFPFFLLAFALLGRVAANVEQRAAVFAFVLDYFPSQFDFITQQFDALGTSGATFGVGGTMALIWGAVGVFGAVSTAVNHAWGVAQPRSFWQHKLLSFLMLGVAALILLVALLLVSASQIVSASWFTEIPAQFPELLVLRGLTAHFATTLLFILVVGLVFYYVPNAKVRFRDVWLGAVLTGLLWKGALAVFSWYVRDMSRFTRVNGSIAVVIVFLVWVYTQAVILLYGAEFTASYTRLREQSENAPAVGAARA